MNEQGAAAVYSAELVSREPKWHFLRIVRSLLGWYPYHRPKPFEADDIREANPTPRLELLIKEKATDTVVARRMLVGSKAGNETMENAEKDLEELSTAEFRDKYVEA